MSGTAQEHWQLWPLLLGLLLHNSCSTHAVYDARRGCLSGCLDCLGVCAGAMHAAVPQAKEQVNKHPSYWNMPAVKFGNYVGSDAVLKFTRNR